MVHRCLSPYRLKFSPTVAGTRGAYHLLTIGALCFILQPMKLGDLRSPRHKLDDYVILTEVLTYHLRSRRPMGARLMTFGLLTVGAYHLLTYGEKLGDLRSPGLR